MKIHPVQLHSFRVVNHQSETAISVFWSIDGQMNKKALKTLKASFFSPAPKDCYNTIAVASQGYPTHLYFAFSTVSSPPGTCTSTTLNLWNLNHSLIYQSWSDCKFIPSDHLTKISQNVATLETLFWGDRPFLNFSSQITESNTGRSMIYLVCSRCQLRQV